MKTTIALLVVLPGSTMAKEKFLQGLPNGSAFSKSLGHSGSGYTAFGQMFSGTWSASLCKQTFPGSSITVGQAFGDPCCTWKQGGKPDFTVSASGFPAQSTNTCTSAGGGTTAGGASGATGQGNAATAGGASGATGQSNAPTPGGGGNGGAPTSGNSGGNSEGNKGDKKSSHKSGKSSEEKSSSKSNKGGKKEGKSSGGGESYSFSSIGKKGSDKGGKEEGGDDRMLRRN